MRIKPSQGTTPKYPALAALAVAAVSMASCQQPKAEEPAPQGFGGVYTKTPKWAQGFGGCIIPTPAERAQLQRTPQEVDGAYVGLPMPGEPLSEPKSPDR